MGHHWNRRHRGLRVYAGFSPGRGLRMIAVADKFPEKAQEFAKTHNIPKAYDTIEELLADPEVEIVYIATPVFAHCELAVKAANAKRTFCWKNRWR